MLSTVLVVLLFAVLAVFAAAVAVVNYSDQRNTVHMCDGVTQYASDRINELEQLVQDLCKTHEMLVDELDKARVDYAKAKFNATEIAEYN